METVRKFMAVNVLVILAVGLMLTGKSSADPTGCLACLGLCILDPSNIFPDDLDYCKLGCALSMCSNFSKRNDSSQSNFSFSLEFLSMSPATTNTVARRWPCHRHLPRRPPLDTPPSSAPTPDAPQTSIAVRRATNRISETSRAPPSSYLSPSLTPTALQPTPVARRATEDVENRMKIISGDCDDLENGTSRTLPSE
ncbi:protein kinase family protein [Striga asiatica]|uniref:Protein kinase family protein n=1 Tax=Striga asiatica TaxID=4170 RepID=A0A5A7QSL9_STRAF|nr:protein kinase family protein [Striga asiatica]